MALDPSIALQIQQPNPANMISSFLDLGQKQVGLQKSRATLQSDIAQRQAESSTAQSAATVNAASVQPAIEKNAADSRAAVTKSELDKYHLQGEYATKANEIAAGLSTDPDFVSGKDSGSIIDKLTEAKQRAINAGIPARQAEVMFAPLVAKAAQDPAAVHGVLLNIVKGGLSAPQQTATMFPAPNQITTGPTVQPAAAGNAALTGVAPGTPQGAPTQLGIAPGAQDQVRIDQIGNPYRELRDAKGNIVSTAGVPGATTGAAGGGQGPTVLPPNETPEARNAIQSERQAVLAQVQNAGQMHSINREIYNIAEGDVATGKLGQLINKAGSAIGYTIGKDEAADYNTLGKMLARSNQQLAQGMGPHTNAGLEQTNAANGTTDYDKNTIKKIANLNDALVTGTQMYQKGLEAAIQQNGIFGKRQFDQAWGAAMDPDALRLKNAVDNGDKGQIQMLVKQAGGPNSAGAKKLLGKLQTLDSLSTNGRP